MISNDTNSTNDTNFVAIFLNCIEVCFGQEKVEFSNVYDNGKKKWTKEIF